MKQPLSLDLLPDEGRRLRFMYKLSVCVGLILMIVLPFAGLMVLQAPDDYQHGLVGKILYIHVPSAWLATLCYTWMTGCALMVICCRAVISYPSMAGCCLATAAPIGALFTLLTLVTGALWGQPAWGVWWVWDARLTAVLMLFFLYLAITGLHVIGSNQEKTPLRAAILTLFGFVLVPIIKFSVQWWQTLHQPTSLWRREGVAIETSMLLPLIGMALAFLLLFVLWHLLSLRAHLLSQQLREMQLAGHAPHHLPTLSQSPINATDLVSPPLPS